MIGGVSAGYFANRFGRKGSLLMNNGVVVVATGLMACSKLAKSYEMLIVGRFIIGLSAGVNTAIAPLYLAEIAPTAFRGLTGTFNQLSITTGVLVSELIGQSFALGTEKLWPALLGFSIVPVIFQLIVLPFCPETPRFLILNKGLDEEARTALTWLRGSSNVTDEVEEMRREREEASRQEKFSVRNLLVDPFLRHALIISLVMQLSQQFSGINAVIYYSTDIFEGANLSEAVSKYATLGTGVINVLMTLISALIVDRAGRRTLHLIGLGGMFVFTTVLSLALIFKDSVSWFSYLSIVSITFYIIFFATGPGSIPWFIVAELFAQGPRPAAVSLSVLVNWFANFTVGLGFPEVKDAIGPYTFIIFAVLLALFWLFTFFRVPETKGRTIEEIQNLFKATRAPVLYREINVTEEDIG
ncbi:solute carrier family 2, facilitated glucose transporter member 1-like [Liolophura sinensis]|uniref:solute carrier family 2, facilitated glucose transporter member 1-like n=1 Tax=Liolophura sinensis TaxID=3198878 RepID=UPI0031592B75